MILTRIATHSPDPGRRWRSRLVVLSVALALAIPAAAAAQTCGEALGDCLWSAMVWDMVMPGVGDALELECYGDYTTCIIRMLMA